MANAPDLSAFLHAIADPARRRILKALREREAEERESWLCAGDIEHCVKLSQPTVSHHMKILEKAHLVEVTKEGTWRRYRRNERVIRVLLQGLKKRL